MWKPKLIKDRESSLSILCSESENSFIEYLHYILPFKHLSEYKVKKAFFIQLWHVKQKCVFCDQELNTLMLIKWKAMPVIIFAYVDS